MVLFYPVEIAENVENEKARTVRIPCVRSKGVLENILDASKILLIDIEWLTVVVKGVTGILGSPDTNAISSRAVWEIEG